MTDTRTFQTIAWTKQGIVRRFFGFNHHAQAIKWLATQA